MAVPSRAVCALKGLKSPRSAASPAICSTADAATRLAGELRPDDVLVFVSAHAPVKNVAMLMENIRMGEAVCAALKDRPVAHVIYISSDAVYKDSAEPISESSCAEPGSLHGAMHLTREVMLRNEFSGPLAFVRPTLDLRNRRPA